MSFVEPADSRRISEEHNVDGGHRYRAKKHDNKEDRAPNASSVSFRTKSSGEKAEEAEKKQNESQATRHALRFAAASSCWFTPLHDGSR